MVAQEAGSTNHVLWCRQFRLLLAQSGHRDGTRQCPLLGVKRTLGSNEVARSCAARKVHGIFARETVMLADEPGVAGEDQARSREFMSAFAERTVV